MTILMIAPTPFFADRGTHVRILEEALGLEKRGHRVIIATYHIGRDIQKEVNTTIEVRRIRRFLFWYRKLEAGPDWQKILLDIFLVPKVLSIALSERPSILHGHLHEGVLIAWIVQKFLFWRKMKVIADFHGSLTEEMRSHDYLRSSIFHIFFQRLESSIDNFGDCAITSSWENSTAIAKIRKRGKVETVLDGVNLDRYERLLPEEEAKKQFHLPPKQVIVTYAGTLVLNKGTQYLLDAIQCLADSPNAFFVIAGYPMEATAHFVRTHHLEDRIRLINPLNYFHLPLLLRASDIAIDPKDSSTHQASGKILGYMAAGLPIVCFDRTNNRQYLGEGGQYAQEVSGKGLADALRPLITDAAERARKGALNQERVHEFTWDHSAEQIEKIYTQG